MAAMPDEIFEAKSLYILKKWERTTHYVKQYILTNLPF